ncbi:alpha-amylase family glycosyl hydrolase [Micropruina sp.]|uniref:alpha-amylase family glycosyl hydrolase n=1 Tax=Micropruina sp. TaxID=2737536 RepID=UPI0039E686C3
MPIAPSPHAGMGAVPHHDGVTFRVWAPNARTVHVAGDFNGWTAAGRVPMAPDHARSGTWSAFVPQARRGSQYKFLIRRGGPYRWRIDPFAREVTHSRGNAVVFDPATIDWGEQPFTMPGWDELVLYELHVGTFTADGDRPGTFDTAIGRLDHLKWLGVNAVEVMPPFSFAGPRSWGYNPSHLFTIDTSYGGPLAFARFVRAAHERGIAVILDVVHNHLGPTDLDLWRFDGSYRRGYGGQYFYNDRRALTPWGATRPNYDRKQVRNFLRDSAVMWLEQFRVDGLRFDGTNYIRSRWGNIHHPRERIAGGHRYLAAMTTDLRLRQPWKLLIAEDMQRDPLVTTPVEDGGLGFHSQWDADFVHPVRRALETPWDADRDTTAVARAVTGHYLRAAHERVIFTESHDEVANGRSRLPETINPGAADSWPSRKRAALGLALVLTSAGMPLLFQGQEFCEDRWFDDRAPLSWDKTHRHSGFLHLARQLIRLRRNLDGTTAGLRGPHTALLRVDDQRKVLMYHRWWQGGPGDDVIVAINLSTQVIDGYRVGLPHAGTWRLRCNSDAPMFGHDFGAVHATDLDAAPIPWDHQPVSADFSIGPYAALVYSQDA